MRAITISRFGGPEVLRAVELPDATPAAGEVSINVTHAAVGLVDIFFRRGDLSDAPGDLAKRPPFVPGLEVAGTVRAVGDGVTDLKVGEPVATLTRIGLGGYASIAIANAALVFPFRGRDIDPAQAVAALPNATTALISLTRVAHIAAGETLLVHGAAGGLASLYPSVARTLGVIEILGTAGSPAKAQAARQLGYTEVLDAASFPAALGDRRVDVIVDPVGGSMRTASLSVLAPLGRLLAVGHASATPEPAVSGDELWFNNQAILGLNSAPSCGLRHSPQGRRVSASCP
jgi:NADPH:quinone reductase